MLSAEESSEFFYDASKNAPPSIQKKDSSSASNEDEFADAAEGNESKEESIASLARKIQETKLTTSTFTPPVQAAPPQPPQAQRQASSQPSGDDDLDLDIDAELENVDTSDVNLNDDLSDD